MTIRNLNSRILITLALVLLSAGIAGAQSQPPSALTCGTSQAAFPPLVRAEGLTELVGDIFITCTGGTVPTAGAQIPQVNITVSLNTTLTSRVLDAATRASEALLLIDDPNAATQRLCATPLVGCVDYAGSTTGPNVFQGIVSGNQVIFYGVPVMPPGLARGRSFRITNIRVNAEYLGAAAGGLISVQAAISTNPSVYLPLGVAQTTVGFVNVGFQFQANGTTFVPCADGSICSLGSVRFREQFATAARTRVGANLTAQNVPGTLWYSESGFWAPDLAGSVGAAGLADFGTRFKAVFQVPAGVRLWVATSIQAASGSNAMHAALTETEGGAYTEVAQGTVVDGVALSELSVVNGTATAVWEVLGADPTALDDFVFPVYASYTGGVSPAGSLGATGSIAPTSDQGAFAADGGGSAQDSTYPVPRFGAMCQVRKQADFDLDGFNDVIWQDPVSGWAQVWYLGGRQGATVTGAVNLTVRNTWRIVGIGDFNRDGHPDVVWQDPVSGAAQVWFMGGSGGNVVTSAAVLSNGNTWRIMSIADFSGDGIPDCIWQDQSSGWAQIWFMGGAQGTTVTSAANLTTRNTWRIAGTGDFNGDGVPDIVWQDPDSGATQIWYLGGAQGNVVQDAVNLVSSNTWKVVSIADFNGNARPDVVWQDPDSGAAQVWFLGETPFRKSASLSGANSWRIMGPK